MTTSTPSRISSIRSQFEKNGSAHQSDLVRLASSKSFRVSARNLRLKKLQQESSSSRSLSTDSLQLDTGHAKDDFSNSVTSHTSLSERMRSAWYIDEGEDSSDEE